MSQRSSIASVNSEFEQLEGVSLYEHVVETCGREATKNFSNQIDLHSIRVICLLGEGSFAKVFFIKKLEPDGSSQYYAMKVLDKTSLKSKDYFSYVKLER